MENEIQRIKRFADDANALAFQLETFIDNEGTELDSNSADTLERLATDIRGSATELRELVAEMESNEQDERYKGLEDSDGD